MFLIPLGVQHSENGTGRCWIPCSGLQLQQLPGSQTGVNLPLAEVKEAREKETIVPSPEGEKKGQRWKVHLATPKSWKRSPV